MTREIERKFLLVAVPHDQPLGEGAHLRQGYLTADADPSVRVRIEPRGATLTIKGGGGLTRTEVELALSEEQAEALWPFTAGRRIDKHRHRITLGAHEVELDVYHGALEGLVTAEVEFASEADATAFTAPDWLGTEVTGEQGWSNASLARHGRPDAAA